MRFLIVLLSGSPSTTINSDGMNRCGDLIKSKPATASYTEGWDRIFGKSSGSTAQN